MPKMSNYAGRANMDSSNVDQQGRKILEFCRSSSFRILNGRINNDKAGKFTRYPSNLKDEPSVIDYALSSKCLMKKIHSFSVLPYTGISDHCCISVNIRINDRNIPEEVTNILPNETCRVHKPVVKYTYDSNKKDIFIQNIVSDNNLSKLKNKLWTETDNTGHNQDKIDNSIALLNNILLSAAKKSFTLKTCNEKISTKKRKKSQACSGVASVKIWGGMMGAKVQETN